MTIIGPTNDNGIVIERKSGFFRFFDILPGRQLQLENITLDGGLAVGKVTPAAMSGQQRVPGKTYRILEKTNINTSASITNIGNVSGTVASGGFITLTTGVTQADGILLLNLQ